MGQTNQPNNFTMCNISSHYDNTQFQFTELAIQKIARLIEKKNINQIAFHFAEGRAGRGSEDIQTECDVNCFGFFFFSVFLMDVMSGKITVNLK